MDSQAYIDIPKHGDEMNYILIYRLEEGLQIKQFKNSDILKQYLDRYFTDFTVKFLNEIPEDLDEIDENVAIVIKGEIIKPKGIEIVKSYEIE